MAEANSVAAGGFRRRGLATRTSDPQSPPSTPPSTLAAPRLLLKPASPTVPSRLKERQSLKMAAPTASEAETTTAPAAPTLAEDKGKGKDGKKPPVVVLVIGQSLLSCHFCAFEGAELASRLFFRQVWPGQARRPSCSDSTPICTARTRLPMWSTWIRLSLTCHTRPTSTSGIRSTTRRL